MRFSRERQASMKSSTVSTPWRSMYDRTRVAWFAISSIMRRFVLREPAVVLEEVRVAEHVGHDQLLVDRSVGLHQVGVDGVVVDDQLVDLREAVGVALGELLVVHAEAPVRVAGGEAAVGGDLVELVVVEDLEDDVVEVEAVLARVAFDLTARLVDPLGQVQGAACRYTLRAKRDSLTRASGGSRGRDAAPPGSMKLTSLFRETV